MKIRISLFSGFGGIRKKPCCLGLFLMVDPAKIGGRATCNVSTAWVMWWIW